MATSTVRDGLAKIGDATDYLSISHETLYKMIRRGEIRVVKIGRATRIPWSELRSIVEGGDAA